VFPIAAPFVPRRFASIVTTYRVAAKSARDGVNETIVPVALTVPTSASRQSKGR